MYRLKKFSGLVLAALLAITAVASADTAFAGRKPSSSKCQSNKSCAPGICVRQSPGDKFGVCCRPETCDTLGAECGAIADGCGGELECGGCEGSCFDNLCIPDTTTTSTTSTTSTTTTTSTLEPTTTTTTPDTTTTTIPASTCSVDGDCESGCCDVSNIESYQCGSTCCLSCWWMCFNACGCPSAASCQYCMDNGAGWGCPQAACGCPQW